MSNNKGGYGTAVAILSLVVAVLAWLFPQQPKETKRPAPSTPSPTPTLTPIPTLTPSPTPTPTPKESSLISGKWVGTYDCSQGITGVTVTISPTESKVKAIFSFYPLSENPYVPSGVFKSEGVFDPNTRWIDFPEGEWELGKRPYTFWKGWKALGFQGQFDEKLETFFGKMKSKTCKPFNLARTKD
jgi:hypothetical protein